MELNFNDVEIIHYDCLLRAALRKFDDDKKQEIARVSCAQGSRSILFS